jgi:DNA-binding PucR family transcriptional regulator
MVLPSPRVRELIRQAAETSLQQVDAWVRAVDEATLSTPITTYIAADPALNEAVRRGNQDNLLAWATANLRAPGKPVPANVSDIQVEVSRDLVRRGMFEAALDAYRSGQNVAWQRWMRVCFSLTRDPNELEELLAVTAASIAAFIDATIAAIAKHMEGERDELTRGSQAERRELVALILQGAPVSRARAERVLAHRLDGDHTAAVVWTTAHDADLGRLERAAEELMRATRARHRLTVVAAATTLWVWLPVATPTDLGQLATVLRSAPDLRVAIGNAAHGEEGFRLSHNNALEARRFMAHVAAPDQVTTFDDVRLASLLTQEPIRAEEFVNHVLGDLALAPSELRETVQVYLRSLGNASATAARLFTHRNTVVRRLDRADQLLPRPLHDDPLRVFAALEILRWGLMNT